MRSQSSNPIQNRASFRESGAWSDLISALAAVVGLVATLGSTYGVVSKIKLLPSVYLTMLAVVIGLGSLLVIAVFLYRWRAAQRKAMIRELKKSERELFQSIEATTAKLLGH